MASDSEGERTSQPHSGKTGAPEKKEDLPRILLVDDDPFMLCLVQEMLDDIGRYDIRTECDARHALLTLPQFVPDLIICDLSMPGLDGIAFMRLAAVAAFHGSVLLHTSMDPSVRKAAENVGRAYGLHMLGAYPKPIWRESLRGALGRLAHLHGDRSPRAPISQLSLEELQEGMRADRVEVYYQPKVSVHERTMVGVECLARWRHPSRGMLPPAAFIALIEQYQLIDEFTLIVLRKGLADLGRWLRAGHDFKIAVNVSMDNLNRLDLPETFHQLALDAGVPPDHVVLELTETRLMDNLTVSLEILTRLRMLGFRLSIDDFGTGYSTMENLKHIPFNELKIDRVFVDGASTDRAARSILESSIRLGKVFRLTLVAEGVETEEDWNLIAASGCDQVQGYFVAKPMAACELLNWKNRWEAQTSLATAWRRATQPAAPPAQPPPMFFDPDI